MSQPKRGIPRVFETCYSGGRVAPNSSEGSKTGATKMAGIQYIIRRANLELSLSGGQGVLS